MWVKPKVFVVSAINGILQKSEDEFEFVLKHANAAYSSIKP